MQELFEHDLHQAKITQIKDNIRQVRGVRELVFYPSTSFPGRIMVPCSLQSVRRASFPNTSRIVDPTPQTARSRNPQTGVLSAAQAHEQLCSFHTERGDYAAALKHVPREECTEPQQILETCLTSIQLCPRCGRAGESVFRQLG